MWAVGLLRDSTMDRESRHKPGLKIQGWDQTNIPTLSSQRGAKSTSTTHVEKKPTPNPRRPIDEPMRLPWPLRVGGAAARLCISAMPHVESFRQGYWFRPDDPLRRGDRRAKLSKDPGIRRADGGPCCVNRAGCFETLVLLAAWSATDLEDGSPGPRYRQIRPRRDISDRPALHRPDRRAATVNASYTRYTKHHLPARHRTGQMQRFNVRAAEGQS